jgi:hypothetical protein
MGEQAEGHARFSLNRDCVPNQIVELLNTHI